MGARSTATRTACSMGSTSAPTLRSAPRSTRTAARSAATATASRAASTSATARPRVPGWTRRAAPWTATATACSTAWTSASTSPRGPRWAPRGARWGARGAPRDGRGHGVLDGWHQCEHTPKGAQVDAKGCPIDTDGDGVADGLDQCPNTPAGLKVDANGCPIEVSEKETQLLDTGMIRLQNINFDVNNATIKPESVPLLDEVAAIRLQCPTLTLEIGGHTDNSGLKAKNVALSEARAKAVLGYILQKNPTLGASPFTTVGHRPNAPEATNDSAHGKAKNRRVEFKVTNTEVVKIEREKRHFVPKDTPAPEPEKKK